MEYGFTPSDARRKNQLLVLNSLKESPATYAQLAGKLNLSTTAINNIIVELDKKNIIKYSGVMQIQKPGRRANVIDINDKFGIIILIALASSAGNNFFTITACDIKTNVLGQENIPPIIGNTAALDEHMKLRINILLDKLSPSYGKLLTICIAAPGMVDDTTGILMATCLKKGDGEYNIKECLEREYKVTVHVRSLMSCYAKAEIKKGCLSEGSKFALIFNIDESIGMSFAIDNKPFTGAHGYAGEIGLVKTSLIEGATEPLKQRIKQSLDKELSVTTILINVKKRLKQLNYDVNSFSLEDLFEEFDKNNVIAVEEVINNANKVAAVIKNLVILLDLDNIVITGNAKRFKDLYLNILTDSIKDINQGKVKIFFSKLENAIYDGLVDSAVKIVLDNL